MLPSLLMRQLVGRDVLRGGLMKVTARFLSTDPAPQPKRERAPEIQVRTIRTHEVPLVSALWTNAGIDVGVDHMTSFATTLAPEGFLVALVDGEILACCVSVQVNDELGVQAGLITHPKAKGLGLARKVRYAGNPLLGDRNFIADAVPHMVDTYHSWGFTHRDYNNVALSGRLEKGKTLSREPLTLGEGLRVVPHREVDFRKITAFDRTLHPASAVRNNYMKWLLERERTSGHVVMRGEEVVALGCQTDIGSANQVFIGPIYAESTLCAEYLFRLLVEEIPEGSLCYMMAPEPNRFALDMTTNAGITMDEAGVRISSKGPVPLPLHKIYAPTPAGWAGFSLC